MAKAYKKKFNPNLAKTGVSYTTGDIAELYKTHKNTVRNWCRSGLESFRHGNKIYVYGDTLREFHKKRNNNRKKKCRIDEIYCLTCQKPVVPFDRDVDLIFIIKNRFNLQGLCPNCGALVCKIGSLRKIDFYKKSFKLKTLPPKRLYEVSTPSACCDIKEDN